MQKIKKALKKLANLSQKKPAKPTKPAQPAKKTAPVKKQTQLVAKTSQGKQVGKKDKKLASAPKKPAVATKSTQKPQAAAAKDLKANLKKKPAFAEAAKAGPPKAAEKAAEKITKKAAVPHPVTAVSKVTPSKKKEESSFRTENAPVVVAGEAKSATEEVILTDADGRRYCRVKDCDQAATVDSHCRFHYLLFWKNIQNRKKILSEGKLERYIEELTARYPDKYLELLRKDLRSEKDFMAAIQELEIDDTSGENEFEDEAQSYLDEVRGMSSEVSNDREEDF